MNTVRRLLQWLTQADKWEQMKADRYAAASAACMCPRLLTFSPVAASMAVPKHYEPCPIWREAQQ